MDAITQINSNTTSVLQQNPSVNGELGKDQFLQLLVSQLRNQDPMNPMEGAEFASQLAQFNQVEQLINVNDNIQAMMQNQNNSMAGLNNTLATTLTGKNVRALGDQITLGESGEANISYRLSDFATDVEINVRDSAGNVVRTETVTAQQAGNHDWKWDGTNDAGTAMPEGDYTFEVTAKNQDADVNTLTFIEGKVERVKFGSEGVQLYVNGMYISLGDIEEIGETPQ